MTWALLALVAALGTALRDAGTKQATRVGGDPLAVAFGVAAVPACALGALVLVRGPGPPEPGFFGALAVSGAINVVTTPLIVWALQQSDLSLVAPLRSITPLFMIPVAGVVLGEWPGWRGGAGVVVIVAGAYLLNATDRGAGAVAPLRSLLRDRGARAMLLVAFLYSVSATFDKVGTLASSPLYWAASVQAVVASALAPAAAWRALRRRGAGRGAPAPVRATLAAGVVAAVAVTAQNTALTLALAAYVIAIKRTSTLFGVLLGGSLFAEGRTRERLAGAVVMLAGLLLVTLG